MSNISRPNNPLPSPLSLEDAIMRDFNLWLDNSYELMLEYWRNTSDNSDLNLMARDLQEEREKQLRLYHGQIPGVCGAHDAERAHQELQYTVPLLRLIRIMADHKAKNHSGKAIIAALLGCIVRQAFNLKVARQENSWSLEHLNHIGWSCALRKKAQATIEQHPLWFAPLPDRLSGDRRPLGEILRDARSSHLIAQKRRLRERICAEMTLDDEERALLVRFL